MSDTSVRGARGPRPRPGADRPVAPRQGEQPQKTPQEKIDEFWKKFTTEAPGKATTVIPRAEYAPKADKTETTAAGAEASFEEAAAQCQAKVAKIVRECRRVNQRYRDPHFDLEFDLKMGRRDCLESLGNFRGSGGSGSGSDSDSEGNRSDVSSSTRGPRGGGGGARGRGEGPVTRGRNIPGWNFRPRAVKRVGEIFDEPKFYIEGPTANDVRQGRDGDCWLMAALCTLSNKPGLIEKICVARDEAVGVYGFVFHRDGEWYSVIIDDKLYLTKPDYDELHLERLLWDDRDRVNSDETYRKTYQSNSGALYFAQCENPNETWLPLLEKAYAKAHGDYAAIEGGFTGEGIEDLTGGVTSELFTTDILDKEYFWKQELTKVNEQFLFGCSTGVWGRGLGERKGIYELHAYSIMRAVEVDGQRLVLLKNPWGQGEWKGAWSDGSKEWTPEWLAKLNHRFGDDGAFWISYGDLLRKYQAFDRTRLFGPDWKMASIWTTLSVPWTLEYHHTKFTFSLARPGPVVLVLSQLDDRYFRGLEGQYRFDLSFRLHRVGEEDDYVVRSPINYRMNRSVNVELDLEAGEYHVLVRVDAARDDAIMPVEDVVRANAKRRREKLIRIGLAYDLAHAKGKMVESAEEKAAHEAYEKRQREKKRATVKKSLMHYRERDHYVRVKEVERKKKRKARREAKWRAAEDRSRRDWDEDRADAEDERRDERRDDRRYDEKHDKHDKHEKRDGEESTSSPDVGGNHTPETEPLGSPSTAKGTDTLEPEDSEHTEEYRTPKGSKAPTVKSADPDSDHSGGTDAEAAAEWRRRRQDQRRRMARPPQRSPSPFERPPFERRPFEHRPFERGPRDVPDDASSVSSVSDISERALDYLIEDNKRRGTRTPPPEPPQPEPPRWPARPEPVRERESEPWNAMVVVGFRVYYKVLSEAAESDVVQLQVVRPNPYPASDEEREGEKEKEKETDKRDERRLLDLDDSAKDASFQEVKKEK